MVMMRPPSRRKGTAARTAATTPPTFTANSRSSAARSAIWSLMAPAANTPALLTRMSSRPTSLATMGINPPSLYAAFGNKEMLFKEALDRCEALRDEIMEEAFAAPTARESMTRLLQGTADRLSDKDKPRGCLMMQGAL